MKDFQMVELEILKKVDALCRENNISYFIIDGTALGAVRHKGFIPWDDDVDIGMPREDYEKFLKLCEEKLPPEYFLQNTQSEPMYPYGFSKIRKNSTAYIEKSLKGYPIHLGIGIDIFPYDGTPKNKLFLRIIFLYCDFLKSLAFFKVQAYLNKKNKKHLDFINLIKTNGIVFALAKTVLYLFSCFFTLKYLIDKLDKISTKYKVDSSDHLCFYSGPLKTKIYYTSKDILLPEKDIVFEGSLLKGPAHIHTYLSLRYGDYMTPPPEDKRIAHETEIIDVNNGFEKYSIHE